MCSVGIHHGHYSLCPHLVEGRSVARNLKINLQNINLQCREMILDQGVILTWSYSFYSNDLLFNSSKYIVYMAKFESDNINSTTLNKWIRGMCV